MPVKKLKLEELISLLIKDVSAVDKDGELSRSQKTAKLGRIANSYKSKVYTDQRRTEENRIALSTYHKYLTKARNRVTEQGWLHHSLSDTIDSLIKNYPLYEKEISNLKDLPLTATRLKNKELVDALGDTSQIMDALGKLNFGDRVLKNKLSKLSEKYPVYAQMILAMNNQEPAIVRDAYNALVKKLRVSGDLYPKLRNLKIDHEIMRHLIKDDIHADNHTKQNAERLDKKKQNSIAIDYPTLMAGIHKLLTVPTLQSGKSTGWAYSRLAVGIAFCTGRRAIEVITQGRFKKINDHLIEFRGQAKRRSGVNYNERFEIYTLFDADLVLQAIENLRNTPKILEMSGITEGNDHYRANDLINNRIASPLNQQIKQFMEEIGLQTSISKREWIFKDTRAIYAAIAFKLHFETDPRWEKKDPDLFFSEILAHDDKEAQSAYKQFKIQGIDNDWMPEQRSEGDPGTKAAALAALDNLDDIKHGQALAKIHTWVKEQVAKNPMINITQSMISREVGANRPAIKRYVTEIAAEALAIVELQKINKAPAEKPSKAKIKAKPKPIVKDKTPGKPRFDLPKDLGDGYWRVAFSIDGEVFESKVSAKNTRDAMLVCWNNYLEQQESVTHWPDSSDIDVKTNKSDGMWHVQAVVNGHVFEQWSKGRVGEAVNGLRQHYKNQISQKS